MGLGSARRIDACSILVVSLLIGSAGSAFAISKDAAVEKCKATVGKALVETCMTESGGKGSVEACKTKATPQIHACVGAALKGN
jgi:hypothetical protein